MLRELATPSGAALRVLAEVDLALRGLGKRRERSDWMDLLSMLGQLLVLIGLVTSVAVMVSSSVWLLVTLLHWLVPSRPRELV